MKTRSRSDSNPATPVSKEKQNLKRTKKQPVTLHISDSDDGASDNDTDSLEMTKLNEGAKKQPVTLHISDSDKSTSDNDTDSLDMTKLNEGYKKQPVTQRISDSDEISSDAENMEIVRLEKRLQMLKGRKLVKRKLNFTLDSEAENILNKNTSMNSKKDLNLRTMSPGTSKDSDSTEKPSPSKKYKKSTDNTNDSSENWTMDDTLEKEPEARTVIKDVTFGDNLSVTGKVTSLSILTPYESVNRKGHRINFQLEDESGAIQCVAFNETAEKCSKILKLNRVFTLYRPIVKLTKEEYNTKPLHNYELTCTVKTTIIQEKNSPINVADIIHVFTNFTDIAELPRNSLVNVKGTVSDVFLSSEGYSEKISRKFKRQLIILKDANSQYLNVTLWNACIEKVTEADIGKYVEIFDAKTSNYEGIQGIGVNNSRISIHH